MISPTNPMPFNSSNQSLGASNHSFIMALAALAFKYHSKRRWLDRRDTDPRR